MRSSPTVRARSWAVWPLVFFFWMLALHLQKEQRCIEGREHWTWRPGSSLTRSPVWEPPGPTFPSLSPRGHNNSSSQGWLYPKSFWGTLISNVQLLILVIDSHCIKVLQPSVFKGGRLNAWDPWRDGGLHSQGELFRALWNQQGNLWPSEVSNRDQRTYRSKALTHSLPPRPSRAASWRAVFWSLFEKKKKTHSG